MAENEKTVGQAPSTLTGRFLIFMIIAILVDTAMFMINPTIGLAATEAGASATTVGIITSISGITSFALMIIVGPMTMVMQPNIMMGIFLILRGVAYTMYSFYSIPMYIAAKILDGICIAFLIPSMLTIAGDRMNMKSAGTALTVYQSRNSIAKVTGPMLGANGLVLLLGYAANFRIAGAVLMVCGLVAFTFKLKYTEFKKEKFQLRPKNIIGPGMFLPFLIVMLFCMPQMALGSFNMVYAKSVLGIANVGIMMSTGNLVAIFVSPFFGRLGDKIGMKLGILIGCIIYMCGPIIFYLSGVMGWGLVGCIFGACFQYVGFSCLAGMLQAIIIKQAPPEARGVAGNVYSGALNIGSFFGPIILGAVIDASSYGTMYLCCLIPIVLCVIMTYIYYANLQKKNAAAEA